MFSAPAFVTGRLIKRLMLLQTLCCWWFAGAVNVVFVSMHSYTGTPQSLDYVGPAIELAVARANDLYSPQFNFSLVTFNDTSIRTCPEVQTKVAQFYTAFRFDKQSWRRDSDVEVIVPPSCSDAVAAVSDLSREWNVPVVTSGGTDASCDSKIRFPTLLRLLPYQQLELAGVTGSLLDMFGWKDVTVFCDDSATELNTYFALCKALPPYLLRYRKMNSVNTLRYNFKTNPDHNRFLLEASRTSRVFILITHASRLRTLLVLAQKLGMANGDYAFISYEPFKSPAFGNMTWNYGDTDDIFAKPAFEHLLLVTTIRDATNESQALFEKMKQGSVKYGRSYTKDEQVTPFVVGYYLGISIISEIIAEAYTNSTTRIRGTIPRNLALAAWNRNFSIPIGTYHINNNGDLDNNFGVKSLIPGGDQYQAVLLWNKTSDALTASENLTVYWPNKNHTAPPNQPLCGFTGQGPRCQSGATNLRDLVVGVTAAVLTVIVIITSAVVWHRRHLLHNTEWVVTDKDMSSYHQLENKSDHQPVQKRRRSQLHQTLKNNPFPSHVMLHRENQVWVQHYESSEEARLTPAIVVAVNTRMCLRHNNIGDVTGVMLDKNGFGIMSEYFPKGSLDDFIADKGQWIDRTLQLYLLNDIVKGLQYIHLSPIKLHGALSSRNCMVTTQLGIKLTDFGLPFIQKNRIKNYFRNGEYEKLLWAAPEILTKPGHLLTREGDLYSLGIIMYELFFVTNPFRPPDDVEVDDTAYLTYYKDFFDGMLEATTGLSFLIPEITASTLSPEIQTLIEKCWNKNPLQRPSTANIRKVLDKYTGDQKGYSYVDVIIGRLQEYAEDLEYEVGERTKGFLAEKEKSEDLLREILPRTIANTLICGGPVSSEMFESTTVAFTGIWEFSKLFALNSPLSITTILNELYTCMDFILSKFDVYKVETIKDSYMLASGVPVKNGNTHAAQVAYLCCSILLAVEKQRFGNTKIQLYTGFHSGPVAAGVVGNKMPHYCLFGDTVNVASRMATTSERMAIGSVDRSPINTLYSHVLKT